MKFFFAFVFLVFSASVRAQEADPLAVTLPSGKVVHFQAADQKAAFLTARDRTHPAVPASTATPPTQTGHAPSSLGHTALDERPSGTGSVNVSAPVFTANYYLPSAESWVGKPITLSVAYVMLRNELPRSDGMRQLEVETMGILKSTGAQDFGGTLTVLATPEQAQRIITQCGTSLQNGRPSWKTTLIHGQLTILKGVAGGTPEYGLTVTQ